jgi:Cu-Zn family superoxide dismutase
MRALEIPRRAAIDTPGGLPVESAGVAAQRMCVRNVHYPPRVPSVAQPMSAKTREERVMLDLTRFAAILLVLAGLLACGGYDDERTEAAAPEPAPEPAAPADSQPAIRRGTAHMEPKSGSDVTGRAIFILDSGTTEMALQLVNVPPGTHAVHLHETGDCSAPDAASAGDHWNPTGHPHGAWAAPSGFHLGDIGNVEAGADGAVSYTFSTDKWDIGGGGTNDIVGRAVVVHAQPDDFTTQPSGAAGARIACGVVESD